MKKIVLVLLLPITLIIMGCQPEPAEPTPLGTDEELGITAFDFTAADNATRLDGNVIGIVGDATVSATVPYATDINGLKPAITITGSIVAPASGAPQDFRNPVVYTVIADDGRTKSYTVTVIIDDPPSAVPVFRTGQTTDDYLAGDDGHLEAGRAWPSPRFTDNGDGTITDNMTGLMWEQNPDSNYKAWAAALAYADGLTTGDYTDWRLPNILELESLINYNLSYGTDPFQADWLQRQGFSENVHADRYWSSTTRAESTTDAYSVLFSASLISPYYKPNNSLYGIAVRGESAVIPKTGAGPLSEYTLVSGEDGDLQKGVPWPSPRFTDNGNNTVTDNLTGLVWERSVSTSGVNLEAALGEAAAFSAGPYDDWRLPNVRELLSLVNFGEEAVLWLNSSGFTDVQIRYYWSSTRYLPNHANSGVGVYYSPVQDEALSIEGTSGAAWPVRGGEQEESL